MPYHQETCTTCAHWRAQLGIQPDAPYGLYTVPEQGITTIAAVTKMDWPRDTAWVDVEGYIYIYWSGYRRSVCGQKPSLGPLGGPWCHE